MLRGTSPLAARALDHVDRERAVDVSAGTGERLDRQRAEGAAVLASGAVFGRLWVGGGRIVGFKRDRQQPEASGRSLRTLRASLGCRYCPANAESRSGRWSQPPTSAATSSSESFRRVRASRMSGPGWGSFETMPPLITAVVIGKAFKAFCVERNSVAFRFALRVKLDPWKR